LHRRHVVLSPVRGECRLAGQLAGVRGAVGVVLLLLLFGVRGAVVGAEKQP
jgi:hypothetical protein